MTGQDQPFWAYSLDRYSREGVSALCLALQDRHGAEVTLLLFGLWLGSMKLALRDAGAAARCRARIADWQREVVQPMRGARRWLKDRAGAEPAARDRLRSGLQMLEIEAERMQQDMLCALRQEEEATLCHPVPEAEAAMAANAGWFCGPDAASPAVQAQIAELVALCR